MKATEMYHSKEKRIWTVLISAAFAILCVLCTSAQADAAEAVKYITHQNGTESTVTEYTELNTTNVPDNRPNLKEGWYVVKEDVTYNGRLDITGNVRLILCDGVTLNANDGIYVAKPYGGSIIIYAQSQTKEKMGKLNAISAEENCAGIGGNNGSSMPGGDITIYGGNITARGGENAAGIGGGVEGNASKIVINGGYINAEGGEDAAGIGAGEDANSNNIVINAGDVTAKGGEDGAGIGGGSEGSGGHIEINGGRVKTDGGAWGAGIGGGYYAHAGEIIINGGDIDARGTGGVGSIFGTTGSGAGIGAGCKNRKGSDNASNTGGGTIIINGGKIFAGGGSAHESSVYKCGGAGIGNGNDEGYGCRIEIHGGDIEAVPGANAAGIGGGDESYGGTIIIDDKMGKPTIKASSYAGVAPGDEDRFHSIGSGNSADKAADISFNYPEGKIWIHGDWGSAWYEVNRTVTSGERASIIKRGSGLYKEIIISPCDHGDTYYESSNTGHLKKCRWCSLGEGASEEAHSLDKNHKCKVCGSQLHLIKFDARGHGTAPRDQYILDGTRLAEPQALEAEGYDFAGWFTDEKITFLYDFNLLVKEDLNLYAGWSHEHIWGDWEVEKENDCAHEGTEIRKCTTDPAHIERRTTPVNAEKHAGFETKEENRKEATCTEYGSYDVVTRCTECGAVVNINHVGIEPKEHAWSDWHKVEADKWERVCANDPSHVETRTDVPEGHVCKDHLTKVQPKASTCTAEGISQHWVCDVEKGGCGRLYADQNADSELTQSEIIVSKREHTPGDPVKENMSSAGCETPVSYESVTYCKVCNEELSRVTMTDGAALGHDFDVSYEWNEDGSCTATGTCRRDGCGKTVTEKAVVTPMGTKAATCTEDGLITYTAEFVNEAFQTQTRTETVKSPGHAWSDWETVTPETADSGAVIRRTCSRCGETETNKLPGTGSGTEPAGDDSIVSIQGSSIVLSEDAFTYNGEVQKPSIEKIGGLMLKEGTDYTAEWSEEEPVNAGTYTVTITGKGWFKGTATGTFTIDKAANPLNVKGKTVKVKAKKLTKKAQKFKTGKTIKFITPGEGQMTYKLATAKKGKKSFKKFFKVKKKNGKLIVKKKLKKGTYTVKIKTQAAGSENYLPSSVKKIKIRVKVR